MKKLLFMLFFLGLAQAKIPTTGMWYPPQHNGHGFDLQKVGDQYIMLFYTYDADGTPTWLQALPHWQDNKLTGHFNQITYHADNTPPTQITPTTDSFNIDFSTAAVQANCADVVGDEIALISWSIGNHSGSWCVVPILAQAQVRQIDFTGHYYSGEADTGWGITLDYQGTDAIKTEVAVIYYYDAAGWPRWAIGTSQSEDGTSDITMNHVRGYCRSCTPVELTLTEAGTVSHQLNFGAGERLGTIDVDLTYPEQPGGSWSRAQVPLQPISEAEPGSTPLPEFINNDQMVAVTDVTVIPMTNGFPILEHQNLLISSGQFIQFNDLPSFQVPDGAVKIDGRGLYLAPGMSEMHLHIATGNREAAEQTGLLLIANGITTAMDTGSTFAINVPVLAQQFTSGALIGPKLYTGQVAYGPDDNASSQHTVSDANEATQYAETIKNLGFDFIKFYWQLPVTAIDQFFTESERLSLGVIGHLPKTQSMFRSLFFGQKLAVHIQEPHVTYMNNARDPNLFPQVASIFNQHGTFLSPTLAVFESWILVSGNQIDNYNELIHREGHQHTHQAIKNIWRNYFNWDAIQNGDPENLNQLLEFYMQMTKALFDAGVPLLSGTDATGFPGVMAGYGVHEELRLLHQTGIPIADVFAITTRNAGEFIKFSLNEDLGFGTIETGQRADFILTNGNPLESLETIKKPLGVMSQGRFWSQEYLQTQLESLHTNNKNINTSELPYCHHFESK